jgi:peroxiredoxin
MSRFNTLSLRIYLIALSLLTSLALIGCDSSSNLSQKSGIPEFEISELSGKITRHTDLNGKVAVINFWATSCTTCVKEMPQMIEVYKEFAPQGLDFLAIAMSYDPPMYVVNFAKTRELPFRVAMDSEGKAAKAFGKVELTPTTIVIDRKGRILKTYVGEPNWQEFKAVIKTALAERPA